jgi:hypothetical protein
MVESVKKFTDGILKNSLELAKQPGEDRVTIVLASYQEGQVILKKKECKVYLFLCR